MLTLAESDVIIAVLSTIIIFTLLIAFTGSLFIEKHRQRLAIVTGTMAVLLLIVMGISLAAPFLFPFP